MKKILVIDDDRSIVLLLSRRLTQAGYEVITAVDGVQGTKFSFQANPDLIVLDIRFPAGGGMGLLQKLSDSNKTWNIPIIINTSYDDPEIRQKTEEFNVKDFMLKPVDPDELIKKIKEILGE
jgi:two-component system alkaline phosphatase synthesis response regulator PhoP